MISRQKQSPDLEEFFGPSPAQRERYSNRIFTKMPLTVANTSCSLFTPNGDQMILDAHLLAPCKSPNRLPDENSSSTKGSPHLLYTGVLANKQLRHRIHSNISTVLIHTRAGSAVRHYMLILKVYAYTQGIIEHPKWCSIPASTSLWGPACTPRPFYD